METLLAPAVNLFILIAVLFYFLRKPVIEFVTSRHHTLRSELEEVKNLLRLAQNEYDDFNGKLKAVDHEIRSLKEHSQNQARETEARLLSQAKKASELILSDAKVAAQNLFKKCKTDIREEFTRAVLHKAEGEIQSRLTGDDQKRIRREFSTKMGAAR